MHNKYLIFEAQGKNYLALILLLGHMQRKHPNLYTDVILFFKSNRSKYKDEIKHAIFYKTCSGAAFAVDIRVTW